MKGVCVGGVPVPHLQGAGKVLIEERAGHLLAAFGVLLAADLKTPGLLRSSTCRLMSTRAMPNMALVAGLSPHTRMPWADPLDGCRGLGRTGRAYSKYVSM